MTKLYTNEKRLICCEHPKLNHQIGAHVINYGSHYEVGYERVSINTASFGRSETTPDNLTALVIRDTETVIDNIDLVLAELEQHRDRLIEEVKRLKRDGFIWTDEQD